MLMPIFAATVAAAAPQPAVVVPQPIVAVLRPKSPTPCGLEEAPAPSVHVCPAYITYDEDGKEIGGQHD